MGIFLGLISAICWGAGDFLARYATHYLGTYRTLFLMQFVGLIGLGIYLLGTGTLQYLLVSTSWEPWKWALLAAVLNILSSLALYRAFEVGVLTLVSPIASSYAAITVVLAFFSGETLTKVHDIGVGVVLLGVIVAATPLVKASGQAASRGHGLLGGVSWAILASIGYGLTFWIMGFHVTPKLGGIAPVWLIRIITPCLLAILAPCLRQSLHLPQRGQIWWLLLGVGAFDTMAFVAYTIGMTLGQVSIITVLSSLYSVVTVILAWIFLREQLQGSQWVGIGTIFLGIALVNI